LGKEIFPSSPTRGLLGRSGVLGEAARPKGPSGVGQVRVGRGSGEGDIPL